MIKLDVVRIKNSFQHSGLRWRSAKVAEQIMEKVNEVIDAVELGGGGGASLSVYNTFEDLPAASSVANNTVVLVKTTTGILFINRRRKGIYVSDTVNWNYMAEFAASQMSYDNTSSILTATNVQDAIDEVKSTSGLSEAKVRTRSFLKC